MARERLNVTFSPEVLEKIDKRANELGLSRSGFIAYCVNKQLEMEKMIDQLPMMLDLMKEQSKVELLKAQNETGKIGRAERASLS